MNEKVFSSPARIKILTAIALNEGIDFTHLKEKTGLTDGNLSSHLAKLEKAGIIEIKKRFVRKKPKTTYYFSKEGKEKFLSYLSELEEIVRRLKGGRQ